MSAVGLPGGACQRSVSSHEVCLCQRMTGGESGGANQFDRGGDDAASALTASAAAEQTLRRRLELRAFKHHALLFDLK